MMNQNHITAIIQARVGSSRLPRKSIVEIAGKPLLAHIIERVQASTKIAEIVIATTNEQEDLAIQQIALNYRVKVFAGSINDVLDRFYRAATLVKADVIVRITADDPFKDPQIINKFVTHFLTNPEFDLVSEDEKNPSFPEGLAVSVFSFRALEKAWREAKLSSEREHVTPYILKNPHNFKIGTVENDRNLSHYRWTIDYSEDLQFTREIYDRLGNKGIFLMQDILDLLEAEPTLAKINQRVERNKGYKMSLQNDSEMLEVEV